MRLRKTIPEMLWRLLEDMVVVNLHEWLSMSESMLLSSASKQAAEQCLIPHSPLRVISSRSWLNVGNIDSVDMAISGGNIPA